MNHTALVIIGILSLGFIGFVLWHIRPNAKMHRIRFFSGRRISKAIFIFACAATILISVLPMSMSPVWNGDILNQHNQYELIADSILDGHISFDYDVDPRLPEMENPYDPELRDALGVEYHWDHAFYNGKYYMYFGIVPALLVFVPFKLITGMSLTTYHATQLFTALFIVGFFALMRFIASKFFRRISNSIMILGCVSGALMSVWLFSATPSLYCTAISAAVCAEIWSFFFFFKAVYGTKTERGTVISAHIGSLLGALAFGCRPPVALANLILIPVIILLIKNRRITRAAPAKLFAVVIPYILIGAALMWYNYIRFDNPFEFGQSYQLTVADQSQYGNFLSNLSAGRISWWIKFCFLWIPDGIHSVDYGIFITYPMALLSAIWMFRKKNFAAMKNSGMFSMILAIVCSVPVIIVFSSACAPYPLTRYKADFLWLMAIAAFIFVGFGVSNAKHERAVCCGATFMMCLSVAATVLLFWMPYDGNYTFYYWDAMVEYLKNLSLRA